MYFFRKKKPSSKKTTKKKRIKECPLSSPPPLPITREDTNMHIIQTCITMPGGMERRRMVAKIHITQTKARSRLHLPLPKKR